MKTHTTTLILTFFSIIILSGCTPATDNPPQINYNKEDIPEEYKDPYYCEKDDDCKYFISSFCCEPGVINKYHNPRDFPTVIRTCDAYCQPNAKWVPYCVIKENSKGRCNAKKQK